MVIYALHPISVIRFHSVILESPSWRRFLTERSSHSIICMSARALHPSWSRAANEQKGSGVGYTAGRLFLWVSTVWDRRWPCDPYWAGRRELWWILSQRQPAAPGGPGGTAKTRGGTPRPLVTPGRLPDRERRRPEGALLAWEGWVTWRECQFYMPYSLDMYPRLDYSVSNTRIRPEFSRHIFSRVRNGYGSDLVR
jgi:hypothetical protein